MNSHNDWASYFRCIWQIDYVITICTSKICDCRLTASDLQNNKLQMGPGPQPKPTRKRHRKRKRRVVSDSSSSEEDPSSSSSSSSSDASTPKKTVTIPVRQPKPLQHVTDTDESDDEDEESSSDESQDESVPGEEDVHISVPSTRSERDPPAQRDSPSPQPNVDIPPFILPNAPESEKALKERFRKFWMASIAEGFKDDLEEIRKVRDL